ncbi:hypothetical protein [Peribacillus sp. S4]|uniref:hypothetical protein n=1 Tax=Peribacillus sp. S4 TaxID=3384451 RepID=UPI0039892C9D
MIALLKIYKRNITQKDGNTSEIAGAQPYAIYNDGNLQELDESDLLSIFPNSGKIFVPEHYQPPQKEVFRFHELIESNTFDVSRPTSCKYFLGKEVFNLKFFEVIDLDETIANDRHQIVDLLNKGISIPFVVSNHVIFRTADDYLVGPLQMEFINGVYRCKEQDFIQYYQQEVVITAILDKNQERLFCMNQLDSENLVGWIDVANEQRVISDALKQLKDNADLAELSRKMIARLKEWYDSDKAKGPHLQERLQRAIHIMQGHTLNQEEITLFTELVLELDVTKTIIEQRVQQGFEDKYENFLKENAKLVKENNVRKQELDNIKSAYINEFKALETIKYQYSEIKNTMHDKIKHLKSNFASVYAEQMALSNLPTQPMAAISVPNSAQLGFAQFQSILGKSLSSVSDFSNLLNGNLSIFKGNDEKGTLSATILSAIILREPIIIFGASSFELAKCIAKTIACEQMVTVIPEIETFSLNQLNQQYTQFTRNEAVKALVIHNPHTTAALYSLPVYFKQNKWVDEVMPDLTIITIDSLDEALPFIEKMPYAPLINSMDYMSRFMNRRNFRALQSGQLMLEQIEGSVVEEDSISIRREFREWIEDYKDRDVEIPYQLVEWLNQLSSFVSDDEIFEWCYTVFKNAINIRQNDDVVGVEVK